MNCIKEHKFLWWKWKTVEHEYEMKYINKFMYGSETFHVHYECSSCGITMTEKFVSKDSLILRGIPVEDVEKICVKRYEVKK